MFHHTEDKTYHLSRGKMLILLTVLVCSLIWLNSCLYPEKFNMTININKDGQYSFVYDGIMIDDTIREAEMKGESQSKIKNIKEIEDYLHKIPYFKEVKYVGQGKFKVLFKQEGDANSGMYFFDKNNKWFAIEPLFPNIIMIMGSDMNGDIAKTAQKLNFAIDGTIVVTTNATVLGHNARTAPKLFGLFGNYTWEIKSFTGPPPKMLIQLK
jgi:hypothetical protein